MPSRARRWGRPACARWPCTTSRTCAITGYDVVSNRPKVAAYRAPGAPIAAFGVESAMDELARKLGMDPIDAAREERAPGTAPRPPTASTYQRHRLRETLAAAKAHPHYSGAARAQPGARAWPAGFWFNIGGESVGGGAHQRGRHRLGGRRNPDIGGSRASHGDDGGRGAGPARTRRCGRSWPTPPRSAFRC